MITREEMTLFLGDIALVLEILIIACGLIIFDKLYRKNILSKVAAYLLILGGLTLVLCTAYKQVRYHPSGSHRSLNKHEVCHTGKRCKEKKYYRNNKNKEKKIFQKDKVRHSHSAQERGRPFRKNKRSNKYSGDKK